MNRRQLLAWWLAVTGSRITAAVPPGKTAPRLAVEDFTVTLSGVAGAEGLATAPDGTLAFSCDRAAVGIRWPDGRIAFFGEPIATGGLAFDTQGRIIAASVGALHHRPGPLRRIDPATGRVDVLVERLEGRELVASNAPVVARDGTTYCSNGLCLGRDERHLYAAMTAPGRVVAWERLGNGDLRPVGHVGPRLGTVVPNQTAAQIRALPAAERAATGYCDGLVWDRAGTLYVTLPFANRIVAIDWRGRLSTLVHDPEGKRIDFPTNLAWGGPDLRDLLVVARGSGTILRARMPVPGVPGANWPREPEVRPFRTPPPGLGRRRCTWSPARSGRRGGAFRAPGWQVSARRSRRSDDPARCPNH